MEIIVYAELCITGLSFLLIHACTHTQKFTMLSKLLHSCPACQSCTKYSGSVRFWKQVLVCNTSLYVHRSMSLQCNIMKKQLYHKHVVLERCMPVLFLQREYNAGIPGMLISTSCVFSPSLGRTSCLMRLRSSLAHTV